MYFKRRLRDSIVIRWNPKFTLQKSRARARVSASSAMYTRRIFYMPFFPVRMAYIQLFRRLFLPAYSESAAVFRRVLIYGRTSIRR